MRPFIASIATLLVVGCYHGPSLQTFEPALSPDGISATLRTRATRFRAELLEVQDTALVVRVDSTSEIFLVPMRTIRVGSFAQIGEVIFDGQCSAENLARLRSLSRFPAGLTTALRARLYAAYGQTQAKTLQ